MSVLAAPPHVTPTEFRLAVGTVIETALPGTRVKAGRIDGAQRQRPIACIFPVARAAVSDQKTEETITLTVRVWRRWEDPKDSDQPIDPTGLEELSETLLAALSAVQTSLGPWYIEVPSVTFDVEAQGIELTVIGRQYYVFAMCE